MELVCAHKFVAGHACAYAFNDFECGLYAHIRGDEHFFEFIEKIVVDCAVAGDRASYFAPNSLFGAFQPFIEGLFFFSRKKFAEKAHKYVLIYVQIYA